MTEQAKKYLSDILLAVARIEAFTVDIETYDQYQDDIKTQSAVERQLGIIGEAASRYRSMEGVPELEHVHQIVGFRNRIIHAYDTMDSTIIWAVLKNHLVPLKRQVEQFLEAE